MDMQRLVDSFLKIFSLAMPCLCSQLCTSPAVSEYSLVKTSSSYSCPTILQCMLLSWYAMTDAFVMELCFTELKYCPQRNEAHVQHSLVSAPQVLMQRFCLGFCSHTDTCKYLLQNRT